MRQQSSPGALRVSQPGPVTRRALPWLPLAGGILLTFLVACTSAAPPAPSENAPLTADALEVPSRPPSPLEEYLGVGLKLLRGESTQTQERRNQFEREVAECMAKEGFKSVAGESSEPDQPDISARQTYRPWVEKFGFGISIQEKTKDVQKTTNQAGVIRDAMSDGERKAYDMALSPGDGTETGCLSKSHKKVFGDNGQALVAKHADLAQDIAAVRQRITTDTRVLEKEQEWTHCMADTGYPGLKSMADPENIVLRGWDALQGGEKVVLNADDGQASTVAAPTTKPAITDPAEFSKFEVELALLNLDCKQGYLQTLEQVRNEKEKEFIAANKARLDTYRDALQAEGF